VALAKLEYVERVLDVERVCRGTPPNERSGTRIPYGEIKESVAEYLDIGYALDPDVQEYRKDLLEIFPKRGKGGAKTGQSAARFIQQHKSLLEERLVGWIRKSNRRVIKQFLRQLEALCTYEHLWVPDTRRSETLVDLTIMATWHVVDGVHRLSR
jgi:hypothetical protein